MRANAWPLETYCAAPECDHKTAVCLKVQCVRILLRHSHQAQLYVTFISAWQKLAS